MEYSFTQEVKQHLTGNEFKVDIVYATATGVDNM